VTQPDIEVRGLSKAYRIGVRESRPETLAGALAGVVRAPLENLRRLRNLTRLDPSMADADDVAWALRGVDLDVERGQVLGLIGRNGAGKTTLLKILGGITEPTSGSATIRGRVASLLEVGTGFHPDLTGRENIYLSGTILGMRKREIDRKFDEIVAFANVERFIDTPIKWFSSGMAVRLAFAVAAFLEADILLIDEILAVGDATFQRKCIGRMGSLASAGRTVVFVSHNMATVTNLCDRVVHIDGGRVVMDGSPAAVVEEYLRTCRPSGVLVRDGTEPGTPDRQNMMIRRAALVAGGKPVSVVATGDPVRFEVSLRFPPQTRERFNVGLQIRDLRGQPVWGSNSYQHDVAVTGENSPLTVRAVIPSLQLAPGTYTVSLFLDYGGPGELEIVPDALTFDVIWPPGLAATPPQPQWGPLYLPVMWETRGGKGSSMSGEAGAVPS